MADPEIALAKTTGSDSLSAWSLSVNYDRYTGTLTTEGARSFSGRSSIPAGAIPAYGFYVDAKGKPSSLMRASSDFRPGNLRMPIVVYGSTRSSDDLAVLGTIYPTPQGGYDDTFGSNEYHALASFVSFTSLASVYDVSSYCSNARHHYLRIPQDGRLIYTAQNDTIVNQFTHAFKIQSGSTVPTFFDETPTHVVVRGGRDIGWHVPKDADSGWYMNPSDMTTFRSTREIDGNPVSPGYFRMSGVFQTDSAILYHRHDANSGYLAADIGYSTGHYYVPPDAVGVWLFKDVSPVLDAAIVKPVLTLHRSLPTVDIRVYGDSIVTDDTNVILRATYRPSSSVQDVVVDVVTAWNNPNTTILAQSLSVLTIPADATSMELEAFVADGYLPSSADIRIVAPTQMRGCNPMQTSDWPEVVPGYVRSVAL